MLLKDYPGLERGLARLARVEDVLRIFAMTPLHERINGVEVRQLTPRMLDLLVLINSIFLIEPAQRKDFLILAQPEDVGRFLWIVSLNNPLDGTPPPEDFFANLRPEEPEYFRRFYRSIDRYLSRAFLDRPDNPLNGRLVPTSYSASFVNRVARAYSWPAEVLDRRYRPIPFKGVLDMPVARVNQYIRWIRLDKDPSTPLFSRLQDAYRSRCILKWRARAVAAGFGDNIQTVDVRSYLISIGKLPFPLAAGAACRSTQPLNSSTSQH